MQKESKILVIDISTMMAGSQKVTKNVVNGLKSNGLKINPLIRDQQNSIRDIYKYDNPSFFVFDKYLGKYFGTGNFNVSSLHFFSKLFLCLLILIWNMQVVFVAFKNKTKVIYCYDPKGVIVCGLFTKLLGFKVIWHLHGELKFPKKMNEILCQMATKIIVPSNYIKTEISNISDSTTIYNGFDFIDCIRRLEKKDNVYELIYVGTIVPQKGLHTVLNALQENLSQIDRCAIYNLTVLGEPVGDIGRAYQKHLHSLIKKLPVNVNVTFLGWVNEPLEYIANSDVLVFSSVQEGEITLSEQLIRFSSSEALPTVLIEALAFSVPVIANNISGVKEIIPDDGSSFIVDDFNTLDIYELINKTNSQNRVNQELIRDKFGRKQMDEKIFNIVKRYL